MTLEEELYDLEIAAIQARAQNFPGLADAFDRVADNLRSEVSLSPDLDTLNASTEAVPMSHFTRHASGATIAA